MYTQGSRRSSEAEDVVLEIKRQVFHLILISLWLIPILFFPYTLTLLTFLSVLVLNLAVVLRVEPFYRFFSLLIEHLERERNLDRPGIQALYANAGVFLAFLMFGKLSMFGVLVLSVGDSLSTFVGKLFGRNRIFFNPSKSWEGTLAFFLGSFLVLSLTADLRTALIVSSLCALLEALDTRIDDNLILPVSASSLAYLVW